MWFSQDLIDYFARIPLEERKKVKVVTSDLWESTRRKLPKVFPNAILVADTFHFLRHLMWPFQHIWVRVMKLQEKGSYPYYLLKKRLKIFTKYYGDLSSKHFYDYHLKYHITPLEIRVIGETLHPYLKQALAFKDTFFQALRSMNAKEAREFLPDYIHQLKKSKIPEFKPFIATLKNWQEEIIQSFIEVDEETGEVIRPYYSNAIIERVNNKIKVIKRVS